MKIMWKNLIIIFIVVIIIYGIYVIFQIIYVLVPWVVPWMGNIIFTNPPKPEITYGEFSFSLTYEIDDEVRAIEDTVICKFDGFELHGEGGKYRKWKTYLKSGNERITLMDISYLDEKDDFGHMILELYFSYGNGEYYMGDVENSLTPKISNYVAYMYQNTDGTIGYSAFESDMAWEKYKIRLISWESDMPIENSFK